MLVKFVTLVSWVILLPCGFFCLCALLASMAPSNTIVETSEYHKGFWALLLICVLPACWLIARYWL